MLGGINPSQMKAMMTTMVIQVAAVMVSPEPEG